jgi:[ribosomal protein S5]-alanine N-acetyltransferase
MLTLQNDVVTPRLVLRLMEREVIDSCLAGDLQRAERLSGTEIPSELLDEPTALTYARTKLDADPQYQPWSIRAIILRANQTMVGHLRFHSCPDPDYLHPFARPAVEFGYHVFSQYRRRGYATEAAHAVMDWAWVTFGVRHFIVCVAPDNEASLAVIAHLGFARIGQHVDETDGIEHIYLCQKGI